MRMQRVTSRIAEWVASANIDLQGDLLARARNGLTDTIGCMVAGAGDESAGAVRRTALMYAGAAAESASVFGSVRRAPAPWAALANGMAAHALDYDDVFSPGSNHASAVLVPALLAAGETSGASGARLLQAYAVGLEVQAVLGRGIGRGHYDVGWHNTSTIGCIGGAAACAHLLGLDAERTRHAISLSVSMAGGPKVQFGSPAKPMHAGLAAQHAVLAADLARNGMQAHPEAIEGERGFTDLFHGASDTDWAGLLAELGQPLAIESFGLSPKFYPCCGSTHRALDGVLELRAAHDIRVEDVASVRTLVAYGNARNLCYPDPTQEMEARFSMNYCVAVALHFGRVSLSDFTVLSVQRPEIRATMPLVTMEARPADAEGSDPASRLPHEVTITLKDGRVVSTSVLNAKGSSLNPLTAEDVTAKFNDCCEGFLEPSALARAQEALARVEQLDTLDELTRHLGFEATADRGERFLARSRAA